jgi:hypothetical protein
VGVRGYVASQEDRLRVRALCVTRPSPRTEHPRWTRPQSNGLSAESLVLGGDGRDFFSNYSPSSPAIRNKPECPCSWLRGVFLVARKSVAPREFAERLTCLGRLTKSWRWPNAIGRFDRNRATDFLSTVSARGGQAGPRKTFYRRSFRFGCRIDAGPWTEKTD